jgi:cytochrome P450
MRYGDEWRRQRKLVASEFTVSSIHKYAAVQENEVRQMVHRILADPSLLREYIRR